MADTLYHIRYEFRFDKGKIEQFDIPLDSETLLIQWTRLESLPAWTKLAYNQCRCCNLTEEKERFCPIAENLSIVVSHFKSIISYERCMVSWSYYALLNLLLLFAQSIQSKLL